MPTDLSPDDDAGAETVAETVADLCARFSVSDDATVARA